VTGLDLHPHPQFVGLSCYTANLASYLAAERTDPETYLAASVRLAVRTDLPGGLLAFSHHRYPLDRLPDGARLRPTVATRPADAVAGIADELDRHGRVLVRTDNGRLPWSPSYGSGNPAPHWLLVDGRGPDGWHVLDAFAGLLPAGEQRPYVGWLGTDRLVDAMTRPARRSPEQRQREALAFGFPTPAPGPGLCWLRRTADDHAAPRLTGNWLVDIADVLPFLAEYVDAQGVRAARHLDDLWTAAGHHVFRYRWLYRDADLSAAEQGGLAAARTAWAKLPAALRFAVDSAGRGRPRPALARRTLHDLTRLELELAAWTASRVQPLAPTPGYRPAIRRDL
jgi:hypothetical protein